MGRFFFSQNSLDIVTNDLNVVPAMLDFTKVGGSGICTIVISPLIAVPIVTNFDPEWITTNYNSNSHELTITVADNSGGSRFGFIGLKHPSDESITGSIEIMQSGS